MANFIGNDFDNEIGGGTNNDEIYGFGGSDRLVGFEGNDLLVGGTGDDRLEGGPGADTLMGDEGNDALLGGDGNDALTGGAGADSFIVNFPSILTEGVDVVADFNRAQGDKIVFSQMSSTNLANLRANVMDVNSDGRSDTVLTFANVSNWSLTMLGHSGFSFDLDVNATPPHIFYGHEFSNSIGGSNSADEIYGFGGDDRLVGFEGNDLIVGGAGNDRLEGGSDADTLMGDAGNDTLIGDLGNDALTGGAGADQFVINVPRIHTEGVDVFADYSRAQGDKVVFSQASRALVQQHLQVTEVDVNRDGTMDTVLNAAAVPGWSVTIMGLRGFSLDLDAVFTG